MQIATDASRAALHRISMIPGTEVTAVADLFQDRVDDDALHVKYTGVSNAIVRKNLAYLVAAKAELEVRCLAVPGCTDGEDLAARHRYLDSLGIPESSIVDLEYLDYARSKYLALGMEDTMPTKVKGTTT